MAALSAWLMSCTDSKPAGSLESELNAMILEKTQRAGFYRASAQQAEKNGYAEVATYLGELAQEEQLQASKAAVLEAAPSKDTKKNIGTLMALEKSADTRLQTLSAAALEEGNTALSALLAQMQADDQRHAQGLKGILERVK